MLPRADILLSRIRQESDTVDDNSLSDFVLLQYMNDAQREIQRIILSQDQLNNVFTTYTSITAVSGQNEYDLPSNVYAENSLIGVWTLNSDNRPGHKYTKNGFGEGSQAYGYSVRNRKIVLNHNPTQNILVVYNYRYPLIGKRVGGISAVVGQDISMTNIVTGFENVEEYVTIVDKYGTQIATGLYIDSFSSPTLTVEGDITSVTTIHYVIPGKSASSHSSLPEEAETYFKTFVKRKIYAHINSKKIVNNSIFSNDEKESIMDLFADKHSDIEHPFIIDYDYLDI